MNNLLCALLMFVTLQQTVYAQQVDTRTTTTKIADLLALQPAETAERFSEAMTQLERFSDADITALFAKLVPQGQGDNAGIEYTTNSYSYHVLIPGKQTQRTAFVKGAVAALGKLHDKHNQGYVIQLLQNAGDDTAVDALSSYLTDELLSEKSARALARIGTDKAGQALLAALSNASGSVEINLVNALGFMAYAPANEILIAKANGQTADNRKAVWYALSRIADPGAATVLAKAAAEAHFGYEPTEATAAYINLGYSLAEKGDITNARKVANAVLKGAGKSNHVSSQVAALGLLAEVDQAKQLNALLKAARSTDPVYRDGALRLLTPYLNEVISAKLLKQSAKSGDDAYASVLRYLGRQQQPVAYTAARKALASTNPQVFAAAVQVLRQVGDDGAVNDLLGALPAADPQAGQAIKQALLVAKTKNLVPAALSALNAKNDAATQALLIDVLVQRGAREAMPVVLAAIHNPGSPALTEVAYQALPLVSGPADFEALMEVLPAATGANEQAVQRSIVQAVAGRDDRASVVGQAVAKLQSGDSAVKMKYLPIVAGIGDAKALELVAGYVKDQDERLRLAAIHALSTWHDQQSLPYLVALSRQTAHADNHQQAIFNGLVRTTLASALPADQKVLYLRDAFDVAKDGDQKRSVIRALESTKTYNALLFAGRFLNDGELQSVAANTVMNIALENKQYYGPDVTRLLEKVIELLSGSESAYTREAVIKHLKELPKGSGFVSLFNGQDLSGWKGLISNPIERAKLDAKSLAAEQVKADEAMRKGWYVEGGELHFNGHGDNIATVKQYGDIELLVDWKLAKDGKDGDAGIYLRGTPQVQIWDISRVEVGAQVGSGGLYNNQKHESKPLKVADNALGEWNTFRVTMIGDRVTVYLNGELVTDNVVLENYWDRSQPIFPIEQIELQAHGTHVSYRDVYIRELPRKEVFTLPAAEQAEGFKVLFDGTNMDSWTGNTKDYMVTESGTLGIFPSEGSGGNLYTKEEYADFVFRFAFQLTPGANNGIGIRSPMEGDAAYAGMEIQVLDDGADMYKSLEAHQYHGSVYGIIAAKRGALKPVGEWNEQEIRIKGDDIKVTLNGKVIVDGNLKEATKNGTLDKKNHPGLQRKSGHIAFLGHGSEVHFKDIRIKRL